MACSFWVHTYELRMKTRSITPIVLQLGWFGIYTAIAIAYQKMSKLKYITNATDTTDHRSYKTLVIDHEKLVQFAAYTTFLVSVKIIKYTDLNRTMTVMYLSIGRVRTIIIVVLTFPKKKSKSKLGTLVCLRF